MRDRPRGRKGAAAAACRHRARASAALTARPDFGLTATRSSLLPVTAQRSRSRPKPSSREQQQLVADQRRRPSRSPTVPPRSRRAALRAPRTVADRAGLPASAVAVSTVAHSIAAAGSGSDSSGPRLWTSSIVACGSCVSVRAESCAWTTLPAISTGRIRRPRAPRT